MVPPELDGSNCIDLVIVRPATALRPKLLEYIMNSDWTQKHIEEHSVGTIQSHFNVGAMKDVPVPVPTLEVQEGTLRDMDAITTAATKMAAVLARQAALLKERRQALVTAAVRGELEIPGVRHEGR